MCRGLTRSNVIKLQPILTYTWSKVHHINSIVKNKSIYRHKVPNQKPLKAYIIICILAKSRIWQNLKVQSFVKYKTGLKNLSGWEMFYKKSSVLLSMYKSIHRLIIEMRSCL